MISQKQAVLEAVRVFKPDYEFNGPASLQSVLTTEDKQKMKEFIVNSFLAGEVEMSAEGKAKYFGDRAELNKYTVGLINNWVRKAKEFNGGSGFSYVAKNPGSRAGSGDETLKALRALLKITTDSDARAEIEAAISERTSEIKPKPEINVDALPEHLRHLVG